MDAMSAMPCTARCGRRCGTECTGAAGAVSGMALADATDMTTTAAAGASGCSTAASCGSCRSEEHTSELQSLMRSSYAVFCLKKQTTKARNTQTKHAMTKQ